MRLGDVEAAVGDRIDDGRLGRILAGLALLDWRQGAGMPVVGHDPPGPSLRVPAWEILAPFFHRRPVRVDDRDVDLRPRPGWVRRLAVGDTVAVIGEALRWWRIARLGPLPASPPRVADGVDGQRLAGFLLLPLTSLGVGALIRRVSAPDQNPTRSAL